MRRLSPLPSLLLMTLLTSTLTRADYQAVLDAEAPHLGKEARLLISGRDLSRFTAPRSNPLQVVNTPGQRFANAARVTVEEPTKPIWKVCLTTPNSLVPIRKGDVLFGTFWIRADAGNEEGLGQVHAYLQKPANGWVGLGSIEVRPGTSWRQRYFSTVAKRDFEPGTVNLVFQLGALAQTVEVGGLAVWNLGASVDPKSLPFTRLSYVGREPDAAWRQEAKTRIERHRKGDLSVQVVDAAGNPVGNAQVTATLKRHSFGFGTFPEVHSPVLGTTDDDARYREILKDHFNRVTCAVYPADGWGWPNPETRTHNLATLRWAVDQGFQIRAHTVLWPSWKMSPKAWRGLEGEALQNTILDHVREVMGHLEELKVDEVDLVNETRANNDHEKLLGREAMAAWYKEAAATAPSVPLGINEYGLISSSGVSVENHEHYETIIKELTGHGAPIQVVGLQCHIGEQVTELARAKAVLDRFAKLELPLHITEFTISTDDEELQADYLRDFLTLCFSHPAVEAFTMWGFWEGKIWIQNTALWRKNWEIKPAGQAYADLLQKEWSTNETVPTDAQGQAKIRGFLGDYEVSIQQGNGPAVVTKANLVRQGTNLVVRLGARQ